MREKAGLITGALGMILVLGSAGESDLGGDWTNILISAGLGLALIVISACLLKEE